MNNVLPEPAIEYDYLTRSRLPNGYWAPRPGEKPIIRHAYTQALSGLTLYRTNHYVTLAASEVERLASIDKTPPSKIRVDENLTLLYCDGDFAVWQRSDGTYFTTATPCGSYLTGAYLRVKGLSPAAVNLIGGVRGSDGPGNLCRPGLLIRVAQVLEETVLDSVPGRGHYAGQKLTKLRVLLTDGAEMDLFTWSVGYCEGYGFAVGESAEAVLEAIK